MQVDSSSVWPSETGPFCGHSGPGSHCGWPAFPFAARQQSSCGQPTCRLLAGGRPVGCLQSGALANRAGASTPQLGNKWTPSSPCLLGGCPAVGLPVTRQVVLSFTETASSSEACALHTLPSEDKTPTWSTSLPALGVVGVWGFSYSDKSVVGSHRFNWRFPNG